MRRMLSFLLTLVMTFNMSVPAWAMVAKGIDVGIDKGLELLENEEFTTETPENSSEVLEFEPEVKAYAMLYSDGTLVFQDGNELDDSHGKLVDSFTDFESGSYRGMNETLAFARTNAPWGKYYETIRKIEIKSELTPLKLSNWFYGLKNLETVTGLNNIDTSKVTDMSYMFAGCESLVSVDALDWDISRVTNLSRMFFGCKSLEDVEHISGWDTGRVTSISYMFGNCESLGKIDVSSWDVSNVTNMMGLFSNCYELESVGNLSNWNVERVTNMGEMFSSCRSLRELGDISQWNTKNVQFMDSTFKDCESLTALDLSGWNTLVVQSMESMFKNCINIEMLDILGFDNNSCWNCQMMFENMQNLRQIRVGNRFEFRENLNSPNPEYIADIDGYWYNSKLEAFLGHEIPDNTADTYSILGYTYIKSETEVEVGYIESKTVVPDYQDNNSNLEAEAEIDEIPAEEQTDEEENDFILPKVDTPLILMPIILKDTDEYECIEPFSETINFTYKLVFGRLLWRIGEY